MLLNITREEVETHSHGIIHLEHHMEVQDAELEKMANLYHVGLIIHLQERLVQFTSLSYNELASAAIDQERMMKAVAEADDKKRKRMMPGSAGSGNSSDAPPKYRMVFSPPGGQLHRPQ
jgi:ABC-type transport system involved in Fe-S cluster assembly fused permease/ATPase subunit